MQTLPALCEAHILKRPGFTLRRWWLQEDHHGALRAHGEHYDKLKTSGPLAFVDTDNQVLLDADGTSWHLSAHQCNPFGERVADLGPGLTEQLVALYRQPRAVRRPVVPVIAVNPGA